MNPGTGGAGYASATTAMCLALRYVVSVSGPLQRDRLSTECEYNVYISHLSDHTNLSLLCPSFSAQRIAEAAFLSRRCPADASFPAPRRWLADARPAPFAERHTRSQHYADMFVVGTTRSWVPDSSGVLRTSSPGVRVLSDWRSVGGCR